MKKLRVLPIEHGIPIPTQKRFKSGAKPIAIRETLKQMDIGDSIILADEWYRNLRVSIIDWRNAANELIIKIDWRFYSWGVRLWRIE